jgi:nitrite reductase (NADH) small subunit/3-phenylpropionate/trans-cinnamate dioxygenase ferredoxin subunit
VSLWKDIVFGREDGIRSKLRGALLGGGAGGGSSSSYRPASDRDDDRPEAAEKALSLGVEAPKDVTPPDGFEVVLHREALKPGQVTEIIVAGKAIALANVDGVFHALSNSCPHAEGPLGEGGLSGSTLTCPYHGWQFDVSTGSCLTMGEHKVETYNVEIVEDAVCVEV